MSVTEQSINCKVIEVPVYFDNSIPVCAKSWEESCLFKYTTEFKPCCSINYGQLLINTQGYLTPHKQCPLHTIKE